MTHLRPPRDVHHIRNSGWPPGADTSGHAVLVVVDGVTPIQGDVKADHRAKGVREIRYTERHHVIEMMQVSDTR